MSLTVAEFAAAVADLAEEVPAEYKLVRNPVGNLAIMIDPEDTRTYVGWLDVHTGVHFYWGHPKTGEADPK